MCHPEASVAFARAIKTNTVVSKAVLYEQAMQTIAASGNRLCVSQAPIREAIPPGEPGISDRPPRMGVITYDGMGARLCLTRQRACRRAPEIPKWLPGSWLIHLCPRVPTSIILTVSVFIEFAAVLKNMWLNILCHLTLGIIYLSFTSFLLWFSISASLHQKLELFYLVVQGRNGEFSPSEFLLSTQIGAYQIVLSLIKVISYKILTSK